MSMRMIEQMAAADRVRAEFDAYRARPWWRRLAPYFSQIYFSWLRASGQHIDHYDPRTFGIVEE